MLRGAKPGWVGALLAGALVCASAPAGARDRDRTPRDFTLVFVGGSGGDGATPTLSGLKARLAARRPRDTVVVFTGNYTAAPFPAEDAPGRARAEREARAHVAATAAFVEAGGRVFFVPGGQDFPEAGTAAVRRLRDFLNRAFEDATGRAEVDVMPDADCGTVAVIELTDGLGLLLLNAQWWMQDRREDALLDARCPEKGRHAFGVRLMDALQDYRDRRLIVASHQPLASYGESGGAFTARAHLTPAPVLGTARVLARQAGLVPGDQRHPVVHDYVQGVLEEAERLGSYVFVSGKEANLQYLALERQAQVISGTSGQTAAPTVAARAGDFAQAAPGWVELALAASGEGEARFFLADGSQVFHTALPPVGGRPPPATPPPTQLPTGPVQAGFSRRGVWHPPAPLKWLLGGFYSDAFALSLPFAVLDLETEQGGLRIGKSGGGRQTNTLHAHDRHGGDWRIRSTTKDPTRVLPWPWFRVDPLLSGLDYAYTAVHPEAALAMPRLSEAVGVLHTRPRLMFVPDQVGLGRHRGLLADEVALVEELPDGAIWPGRGSEGFSHFRKFDAMVEKMRDRPARHRLDQEAMLRARLLDVFVGDFDRGRNQWRFAVRAHADGTKTYVPLPIDRDQVFSHYDGAGLWLARVMIPEARKIQPFTGTYGPLAWQVFNSRDFDAVVLNGLSRPRWMSIAAEVQAGLTDAVIDEAMSTWQPQTYALDGARIAAALKARRDGLTEAAAELYRVMNAAVDVVGSTHGDAFDVFFRDHGAVRVTVRDRGTEDPPHFDRVFEAAETHALRLYALAGDDLLSVHGTPHAEIDIRFVGDEGHDRVEAAAPRPGERLEARAIAIYDGPDGADIDPSIAVRDARSPLAEHNQYRPDENHAPDHASFVPGAAATGADGLSVGGTATLVLHDFKKAPFAARHQLSAQVSTLTFGLAVDYRGQFPESADLLDQEVALAVRSPQHTINFFGLTNAWVAPADDADHFRVRQASVDARHGWSFPFDGAHGRVGAQLVGQAFVTEATPGRFVSASPDVAPGALGPTVFVGGRLFAERDTLDRRPLPRRGVALQASVEGRADVVGLNGFSMTHRLAATIAVPFDRGQRLVLITTATLEGIVGEHPFFFAPSLGADQLRAYQPRQLAGDLAFAQTTDLRLDLVRIETVVPGTIGLTASVDHGRVFGATIAGDAYHLSLGGGVWWSIVDRLGVSVAYHQGLLGGSRVSFQLGTRFADHTP